jgi:PPM family protein phosphatase
MTSVPEFNQHGSTSRVEYAAGTSVGRCRRYNEDALGIFEDVDAFIVVDGSGGGEALDTVAGITVDCFRQVLREPAPLKVPEPLAAAVLASNDEVLRHVHSSPGFRGLGASLCAAQVFPERISVVHVGDCRLGRYRSGAFAWLTEDHSLVSEKRRAGASGQQLADLEEFHSNVISRAIGAASSIAVEVSYHPTCPGDVYLLATDGLSRWIEPANIREVLAQHTSDLDGSAQALLRACDERGGRDNATLILLRVRP